MIHVFFVIILAIVLVIDYKDWGKRGGSKEVVEEAAYCIR